jgi:hypothetical protein
VSLALVVHLAWQIFPQIFGKNLKWRFLDYEGHGGG